MKAMVQLFSIAIFLALTQSSFANQSSRGKIEREKEFHQTFMLTSDDRISIANQFGEVRIDLWEESKIQIDVKIWASAKKADKAQALLDMIHIDARKTGNRVKVETELTKGRKTKSHGENQEFRIDYQIKMPNNHVLEVKNQFGDIYVPDYDGRIMLEAQFGTARIGRLSTVDHIDVQFGSLELDRMTGGRGTIQFSSVEIEELVGDVDLKLSFCNDSQIAATATLSALEIDLNNSKLDFIVPRALGAHYKIHTSFGSFKNRTDLPIDKENEGDWDFNFDDRYEGKSGNGQIPVRIKASFSNLRLEH